MEANGGGHALPNGVHQAPPHMEAGGAVGGDELAEHALENGGGHGLANGGGQAPEMEAAAAMEMEAGHEVPPAQAMAAANTPRGILALTELFLRFPAQEIARCRTVCTRWRSITGSDSFRDRYDEHHHRTPMPLFYFQDTDRVRTNLRAVDIRDRASRPVFRFNRPRNHDVFRVHGSCRGILLLSSGRSLYACNPCTRHWGQLPPLHADNEIVGFYVTGAYGHVGFACQVLYRDRKEKESDCVYWIFTLGSRTRRRIGRPGYDDDGLGLDLVLAKGILPSHKLPPVFAFNFLHWLPQAAQDQDNSNVITFNAYLKTFALIPPPIIQVAGQDVPVVGGQLFEIHEELAMTAVSPASVQVWVRNTAAGQWNHQYNILLPVDEIDLNDGYNEDGVLIAGVFAVAQDRNDLVQCPRVLLHCDALGAELQRYQLADHMTSLSMHTIEESLLLHPNILPMRVTDDVAVAGYPPFLRNL